MVIVVAVLVVASNPCLGASVDGTCDTTHGGCTVNASNVAYCFCDSGYELQVNASGFSLCPSKTVWLPVFCFIQEEILY